MRWAAQPAGRLFFRLFFRLFGCGFPLWDFLLDFGDVLLCGLYPFAALLVKLVDRFMCDVIHPSGKAVGRIFTGGTKHYAAFSPFVCPTLKKPPYVCNGCSNHACRHDKYYYRAKDAHSSYEHTKHECRQGINLTSEERASLDDLVSPLILSRQTMDHIFAEHRETIPCLKCTLYRYIDSGILSVRNIDLPRKVKYKPRRQSHDSKRLSREYLLGRTYTDFLEYLENHPDSNVVELDTVVGPEPGKVLLTMLFRNCTFMLAFLMDDTKSSSVVQMFRFLQRELGSDTFARLFPVILTDRGPEFSTPLALECDKYSENLSKVFYCNANAPYQKGRLEKIMSSCVISCQREHRLMP